jgi:hypothetical protein
MTDQPAPIASWNVDGTLTRYAVLLPLLRPPHLRRSLGTARPAGTAVRALPASPAYGAGACDVISTGLGGVDGVPTGRMTTASSDAPSTTRSATDR